MRTVDAVREVEDHLEPWRRSRKIADDDQMIEALRLIISQLIQELEVKEES